MQFPTWCEKMSKKNWGPKHVSKDLFHGSGVSSRISTYQPLLIYPSSCEGRSYLDNTSSDWSAKLWLVNPLAVQRNLLDAPSNQKSNAKSYVLTNSIYLSTVKCEALYFDFNSIQFRFNSIQFHSKRFYKTFFGRMLRK